MVIRILDIAKSVSTYSDGEVIYKAIVDEIANGRDVYVSFEGIRSVPSAFVNSAFIRLVERIPFDEIQRHLHITNSTRQINRIVKDRFAFATGREAVK